MRISSILLMVLAISCNKKASSKFDYNQSADPWISAFKDQVFFSSLRESYRSDGIFKMIEKKDALNPYDGLSQDELMKAKKIGANLIKNIPPPAMCEGCKNGGNYYMATALHYYNSLELDSISKSEYKKHQEKEIH